jgi:hypothetical protein
MNLVIGTANFNRPYGRKQVKADGVQILSKAAQLGVDMIDVSGNYGDYYDLDFWQDLVSGFKIIYKVSTIEQLEWALNTPKSIYAIMAHGIDAWLKLGHIMSNTIPPNIKVGVSLYDPKELEQTFPSVLQIVEIPVNLVDQRWIPLLPHLRIRRVEVVARSLFLHGTLFESKWKGYPLALYSYNMVRANKGIDRIIVGVDTAEQLEEIASYPELEVNYEHLSNNRSKKWLIPIAQQNLPLFGGENSSEQGDREGTTEQVCGQGDCGDDTTTGGQEGSTDSIGE